MKLGMIIPFVHEKHIHYLLKDIFKNDGRPDSILLIDNRPGHPEPIKFSQAVIEVHQPDEPLYVNEAWNYGINYMLYTRRCDLISIFNDDLRLERRFFDKMRTLIETPKNKQYGVFCPETMREENFITTPEHFCIPLTKREGWAWTIRAEVARQMPMIPGELRTFCGDDWYYVWCERFGRPWAKMMGVRLYHFIGESMKTETGQKERDRLVGEKKTLLELI